MLFIHLYSLRLHTVCPSSDLFHIVFYYIGWVTTSRAYNILKGTNILPFYFPWSLSLSLSVSLFSYGFLFIYLRCGARTVAPPSKYAPVYPLIVLLARFSKKTCHAETMLSFLSFHYSLFMSGYQNIFLITTRSEVSLINKSHI